MYRENKNMNQDAHQTILRGDLYYADLSPVVGSEQGESGRYWSSRMMWGTNTAQP